ncbi:MAG TPA: dihydrofolate reductase family protein [Solirubrobacteraceae bacterium]|nr:dihydrofolate reductase family protein [Solirubrobacteraceae bacterium]
MRRLLPDPAEPVDPLELLPEALAGRSHPDRPYLVANFVASADGRATVDGGSTGLGDEGDLRIFRALRGCADALLVGTGTLTVERYGVISRHPPVVSLRERLGLPPQPPLVTISRSGAVPRIPLLDDPGATLIVYTSAADPAPVDATATVLVERRDPDGLTPSAVLADLRASHGVRVLLCEGGPTLFGSLVAAGLCDELFLTLSPMLTGGDGLTITDAMTDRARRGLRLAWALGEGDSLYLRYVLGERDTP